MSERRFERLEDKLENIKETLDLIRMQQMTHDYRLDEYNDHLQEHMRRTEALEKQVGVPYLLKICVGTASTLATILGVVYKITKNLGYL